MIVMSFKEALFRCRAKLDVNSDYELVVFLRAWYPRGTQSGATALGLKALAYQKPLFYRCFWLVAGAGFEPTTFRL